MCHERQPRRRGIKATLDNGMKELTGATDAVEAWKHFFEPGDVVGIKVVPNGQPEAHSSFEIVLEVIEKLKAAGVKTSDIFVYDRYRGEFMDAGYHKILPDGIRWGGLDPDANQFTARFSRLPQRPDRGFDHDAFVWMDLVPYGDDPKDDRKYRSHLGKLVTKTRQQDRGHPGPEGPRLGRRDRRLEEHEPRHGQQRGPLAQQLVHQRLQPVHPADGHHPIIRQKFVLQIMDGIRGVYQGGPFSRENGKWTWENNAILFATDPVALDHVEWDIDRRPAGQEEPAAGRRLGQRRRSTRSRRRASTSASPSTSPWPVRSGMGYFDYKSTQGRRFSIQHRVVDV